MKNAKIYRRSGLENTIFDIPLVLSVFFFWSIFRNFRAIGGDTEHERIFFRSSTSCMRLASKRETKKSPP